MPNQFKGSELRETQGVNVDFGFGITSVLAPASVDNDDTGSSGGSGFQ